MNPQSEDALGRAVGEAHRRYARRINFREKWRGLLSSAIPEDKLRDLREHGRTGYPLGSATFVERLERTVGRRLRPGIPRNPISKRNAKRSA